VKLKSRYALFQLLQLFRFFLMGPGTGRQPSRRRRAPPQETSHALGASSSAARRMRRRSRASVLRPGPGHGSEPLGPARPRPACGDGGVDSERRMAPSCTLDSESGAVSFEFRISEDRATHNCIRVQQKQLQLKHTFCNLTTGVASLGAVEISNRTLFCCQAPP
jgi:hypothetical protein